MNQRIEELAEQADDYAYKEYAKKSSGHDREYFFRQKFAELIVRECVQVVDNMANPEDSERYFWAMQNASEKIKQHFGVRE